MKKLILSAIALMLMSVAAMAQNNNAQRQRMDPTEAYNRQAERLAKQMKLDDDKAEVFKVLYLDYQTARHNAENPKGEKAGEERLDFKKMTDAQATDLIQKQLTAQEAQLAVDKAYLPKFLEILTPVQTAQIYVRGAGNGLQQGNRFGQQGGGQGRPGGMGGQRGGGMGGGQRGGDF